MHLKFLALRLLKTVHMRKLFVTICLAALTVMLSGSTYAADYSDYINIETVLHSGNSAVSGTFDISDDGFNGTAESINWADVQFVVYDNDSNRDVVKMTVGGDYTAGGSVRNGFNLFGGTLLGEALLDLSLDGIIGFTIHWLSGDAFRVSEAALSVQTISNAQPVPDGGSTVMMLGLALLGFGTLHRKLKASRA
jgi:hypothetical protein